MSKDKTTNAVACAIPYDRLACERHAFPNVADCRDARDPYVDRKLLLFQVHRAEPSNRQVDRCLQVPRCYLGEYVRYKRDPNRFYMEYSTADLSFDCERIRDDFVKLTQSIISTELSTSAETIVWREGGTLHLSDNSVFGTEEFAAWKNQIINLANVYHPPRRATTGRYSKPCSHPSGYTHAMRVKSLASRPKETSLMHAGEPATRRVKPLGSDIPAI